MDGWLTANLTAVHDMRCRLDNDDVKCIIELSVSFEYPK